VFSDTFRLSTAQPTWKRFIANRNDGKQRICRTVYILSHSVVALYLFFYRAVDWAGPTASFRTHVNVRIFTGYYTTQFITDYTAAFIPTKLLTVVFSWYIYCGVNSSVRAVSRLKRQRASRQREHGSGCRFLQGSLASKTTCFIVLSTAGANCAGERLTAWWVLDCWFLIYCICSAPVTKATLQHRLC